MRPPKYSVIKGMSAQTAEQTIDTYLGGGVMPVAIPQLLTNSKYSRVPTRIAKDNTAVKIQPQPIRLYLQPIPIATKDNTFLQLTLLMLLST
jgi:hypothetical protein